MSFENDVADYLGSITEEELVELYNNAVGYPVDYIYPMEEFEYVMQKFNFSMIDVADIATSFFYKDDLWFTLNGGDELVSYSSFEDEMYEKIVETIVSTAKDQHTSLGDIEIQDIMERYYGGY